MHYDRDGRFQLRYSAPATIGALVEQAAQGSQGRPVHRPGGGDPARRRAAGGPRSVDVPAGADDRSSPTYADALAEIAHRSLSTVTSTSRASHYRVYLHLSTDGAWLNGGGAIPRAAARPVPHRRRGPAGVGDRGSTRQRRPGHADPARPVPPADRGPRPRLPVPRLHHHPLRRGPPPPRMGRGWSHRRRQPGQPLPVPPRRHRPRRLHHHRRPHPPRRDRRGNRYGHRSAHPVPTSSHHRMAAPARTTCPPRTDRQRENELAGARSSFPLTASSGTP